MKKTNSIVALTVIFSIQIAAQTPVFIPIKSTHSAQNHQENTCNYAGTIDVGQFIGQSNDTDLDQIFLCFSDSIQINHLGDADLSGDPNAATQPGIGYVFYSCPPSISGPTLPDIANDPCILQGGSILFFTTQGVQNGGDTWFFNDGSLQNIFNIGQPLSLFFAPITMDDYVSNAYESGQPGLPPGPCVDVEIDEAFEVVYLNKITATSIDNNFGNDCIGRFTVRNGYPQYDNSKTYAIDISLTSNPDVKAQVMTPSWNLFHLASVPFSVCQPGLYTVSIEDGKSCGHLFQMDMSGCNATDNVALNFEEVAGETGETVCVPLQVANFNIEGGSFSITWDPVLLHFTEINQINPAFVNLTDTSIFVNTALANTGNLGVVFYNALFPDGLFQVLDGASLFEVCFEVLDTTGSDCIAIGISNTVAGITMQDSLGQDLGVCAAAGGVCKPVATSELETWEISKLFPNPLRVGKRAYFDLVSIETLTGQLLLCNAEGKTVQTTEVELSAGENRIVLPTTSLLPGIYFATLSGPKGLLASFKVVVLNP